MNATMKHSNDISSPYSMRGPLLTSTLFHLFLFIFAAVGLPFVAKDPLIISTPISVELLDIDEITQTNRVAPPKKEKKPDEPVKPPPPPEEKPVAPQMTAEAPPDLTLPTPPDIKEEDVAEPEEIPAPPSEPVKKVEVKKPKPKPKPKTEKTKIKPKTDAFASLLKNLAPAEDKTAQDKAEETAENSTASGQISKLSDRLTVSELDAFKHQIEPCWMVPSGVKYAEDMAVEIRVTMNRDMSVQDARVLNSGRYNRDGSFRAAADSALRALRNPRCSPLKLPPDKYEQWKVIVINFDPREML